VCPETYVFYQFSSFPWFSDGVALVMATGGEVSPNPLKKLEKLVKHTGFRGKTYEMSGKTGKTHMFCMRNL